MADQAQTGLPPALKLRVLPQHQAVVLSGPATGNACITEGEPRSILLTAEPGEPGRLTVQAAQVPPAETLGGAEAPWLAMWDLDQVADILDPLDPFAIEQARSDTAHPALQGRLNFRQTQLYEVQAATGNAWRIAAAELSLEWEPRDLDDRMAAQGWDFAARCRQDGLDLRAGAAAFAACPGDAELASVRWYGAGGRQGEIRRQAARAMPLFAGAIARSPSLRRCVDRQESLRDQLRRLYPALGSGGLKRLGRITGGTAEQAALGEAFTQAEGEDAIGVARRRRLGLAGAWKTEEAISWLDGLAQAAGGVDLVPDSDEEWASCSAIWSGMLMPMQAHLGGDSMRITAPGGKWQALHAALARDLEWPAGDLPARQPLNVAIVDAVELADQLATDIILPVIHQAVVRHGGDRHPGYGGAVARPETLQAARLAAIGMLVPVRAKQPCRAVATSVRQGLTRLTRLEGIRAATETAIPETATGAGWAARNWEIPFRSPEMQVANGATFSFIQDIDTLKAEGSRMRHCIGRSTMPYWRRCWAGEGLAAHVTPAWQTGSDNAAKGATAFFTIEHGDTRPTLSLRSLYGFANASVRQTGNRFRQAVDELLAMHARQELEANPHWPAFLAWAETPAARQLRGADPDAAPRRSRLHAICGRDPGDAAMTQALWAEWREVIPGASGIDAPGRAVWRSAAAREVLSMASQSTYEAMLGAAPAARQGQAAVLEAAP